MPELPEVERARKSLEQVAKGNIISEILTSEDSIVFANTTHEEFAQSVKGKKCLEVKRKGKNFYVSRILVVLYSAGNSKSIRSKLTLML